MENEEIDAALLATREDRKGLNQEKLYEEEMLFFVNENHPLLEKKNISVRDIKAGGIWLLEEGLCLRDQIIKLCDLRLKQSRLPGNLNFKVGNFESLRHLVQENFGYTLLPHSSTLKLSPQEKRLLRHFSGAVPKRSVYLTVSRTGTKEAALRALKSEILHSLPATVGERQGS